MIKITGFSSPVCPYVFLHPPIQDFQYFRGHHGRSLYREKTLESNRSALTLLKSINFLALSELFHFLVQLPHLPWGCCED